jgi:hypothetical protein
MSCHELKIVDSNHSDRLNSNSNFETWTTVSKLQERSTVQ